MLLTFPEDSMTLRPLRPAVARPTTTPAGLSRPAPTAAGAPAPAARADAWRAAASPATAAARAAAVGLRVPTAELARGLKGAEVKDLQDVAVTLGYLTKEQAATGPGLFGPRTEGAVRAMQAKHQLPQTGTFDAATSAAVARELDAYLNPQPVEPGAPAVPAAGLARNAEGAQVKQLQDALVQTGDLTPEQVATGPGLFGPRTENAVRALQARSGLPVTGTYDEATRVALSKELAQHAHPEKLVAATYERLLGRAPTAAELTEATQAATRLRDGGGSLKDMRADLVRGLRSTEEYRALHPLGHGAVDSLAAADEYFLTQWGPTPFNSNAAPYGYNDCGPASAAMALASLGLIDRPGPAEAAATIDALRDAALGKDTTFSTRMGFGTLANAVSKYGGTTQMLPPPAIDSIDAALERGNPVIIGGNPWEAWGKAERGAGNYLNGRDPGGHFVTVLGKTPEGHYIVADPLVKGGSIAVSEAQLKQFFASGFGAMEVSRP